MREDIWKFAGVLLIALVIGILTHHVLLLLLLGTGLCLLHQQRNLYRLRRWLQNREKHRPPDARGLLAEVCREIDYRFEHHQSRKQTLSTYLKRFQEAASALPDGTIVLGEAGEIEWANDAARRYLGVRWPQDARQRIANLIRHPQLPSLLEAHSGATQALEIPSPVHPDMRLSLFTVPYGSTQRLFIARDVTKLYRLNRMRSDFIANASHELRTPLTVINGYLETLEEDQGQWPEASRSSFTQMRRQTERMRNLINDLLLLSALEHDEAVPSPELVRVPEMLSAIYMEANALSGAREHIFYLEADPKLWIMGNYNELYSAFSNLVINAVQYTPGKGIIRIRWYADNEGAHMHVSDTGIGIPESHRLRITERFYRVDKGRSRESGGTGLGLAIVKHVLARHNASLHIESTPGKGSTFRCDFPPATIAQGDAQPGLSSSA
ncbi:MAG: phosphate regulon sensor histidine kinase PhoR [Gammaproteobacteria bacterium]|nr:phosphate regulon sensor histidine kinase PhoR [Gammaproteobacteria bacterium]MCI0591450.1 phosphate regulon sensor histidine kinase PhoR [Gammaproteobacteria bacterium]